MAEYKQQQSESGSKPSSSDADGNSNELQPGGTFCLPSTTSSWKREHIEELKIYIDETKYSDPLDLVKLLAEFKDYHWSDIEKHVDKMAQSIEKSTAYQWIDCPFDRLTTGRSAVVERLANRKDMWDIPSIDLKNDPVMTEFKINFKTAGTDFAERLIGCIDLKDNHETVTEYMYQHLFISFLCLFSIRCQFAPCVHTKNTTINGRTISGTPDVVVRSLKFNSAKVEPIVDWRTLAICEVKKDFKREEVSAPKKRRFSRTRNAMLPSLPDDVLGRHGAELLLYHPTSIKEDLVIGMIVEQTHITFVGLALTKHQYNQLIDGNLMDYDMINGPKLFVTQPYDYLVWEDRKHLTRALLTLGLLQNYKRSEFSKEKT